ncbi:sel1 repeat family protein [Sphingomonas sp. So64.6b]|uniref:tetratricopeptide repeat protein n=1 Tax=Sphingomonas sp. So64.6b TaxID=2997354 RepID=UPI0015FFFB8A|nr:tetratricopeptide repeat protein [Sphingomonas sp. So64.6b]QNA85821.1 sel1 repeat family protein [Sphingomonas sp. So64.6b]
MIMSSAILLLLGQGGQAVPLVSPEVHALAQRANNLGGEALVEKLEKLAVGGDASANEFLGEIFNRGGFAGLAADPARACNYFKRTATVRGDSAQNLAQCLYNGRGMTRDLPRARLLYRQAQELGYPKSGCALGNMMIKGEGGVRDPAAGLALCRAGAAAGDPDAATDLGGYLLTGEHIAKDAVEARRWLTDAAQQKQPNAAFLLGQIYWNGDGVPLDRVVAARWWRVAYDNGRPDAALMLGREAFSRMLIKRDGKNFVDKAAMEEARQWLTLAASADKYAAQRTEAQQLLKTLDDLAKDRD